MKIQYVNCIKNAFKSKEYWFGFAIVIISCVLTSIYNLSPDGIFGSNQIGSSEFFIAATMYGNTLLQITAPLIAIFVCMNHKSLFAKDKEGIVSSWRTKEMKVHILSILTIGGSVFVFSFLLLLISGVIIFPLSTGSIPPNYGLFKELYQHTPIGYVFAYIFHSFICGALFALFGASLKVLIAKPGNIVLFVPLVFYSCFIRIGGLFAFGGIISFVSPLFTFDIAVFDVPTLKRIAELSTVLVISLILIAISYRKVFKNSKTEKQAKMSMGSKRINISRNKKERL